ncbi:MAG: hypothetical protein H6706_02105 [Myxococcales bacterium]|nr:hypothetical protein [Myxococcales bacterium]
MLARPLLPLLTLLLGAGAALAGPDITPVGDGGSYALTFESRSVHPQSARVVAGTAGLDAPVEPFQRLVAVAQCIGTPPPLHGGLGDADDPLPVPALDFPDGPPALWIHRERAGRAALEKRIQEVRAGLALRHLTPAEVPVHFAALRFAPLILIEINDWAELAAGQRAALRGAVAAGSVLVVGGGEGPVAADALAAVLPVQAGTAERAGPALTAALQHASGHRVLTPGPGAQARILADGAPVLVDGPHGLGQVRVAAVRLTELDAGAVAQALFAEAPDALGTVLAWLQAAPPLAEARSAPLAAYAWYLLAGLAFLGLLARFAPRVAVVLVVPLGVTAAVLPPTSADWTPRAGRVLYIRAGAEALAIGTVDVTLQRGGAHALPAGGAEISLEDARPGGACALLAPGQAFWAVAGEPGARRRLTFFALQAAPQAGPPGAETLPAWPAGPLAAAPLQPVEGASVPLAGGPVQVAGWLTDATPPAAKPPAVLAAPPEPE